MLIAEAWSKFIFRERDKKLLVYYEKIGAIVATVAQIPGVSFLQRL
jgi:hypothetical protein